MKIIKRVVLLIILAISLCSCTCSYHDIISIYRQNDTYIIDYADINCEIKTIEIDKSDIRITTSRSDDTPSIMILDDTKILIILPGGYRIESLNNNFKNK